MSTFKTPVGPQPSRVYWRRRLIVGLGLLAVVIVIILIVSRLNSGTPTPTGSKSPVPSPSTSASDDPTAAAGDACDPAKVTVDSIVDSNSFDAGVNPKLSFTLKSTNAAACTFAAGSDVQEFRITSGDELIWSSKDCQTDPVAALASLKTGVPLQGPAISWDRTRSSADTCDTPGEAVVAGGASYHLEVVVNGITSKNDNQFLLY